MKVAILGAGGQLGTDLRRVMADWDVTPFRHADLDICDYQAVRKALEESDPDVVVNAAGYVRVDDAESQPEEAFRVNAFGVRNLAQVCAARGCILMHVSTDYVFDGRQSVPYTEDDCPNPVNVYGASKLAGEGFVRNLCPRHFVVRSSGLYGAAGSSGKGGNFIVTMLGLAKEGKPIRVVNDQVLTPTYTRDLAEMMRELLKTGAFGLYHATNAGQCSWYEFAERAFGLSGSLPDLAPTSSQAYRSLARRPSYSVLSVTNVSRTTGIDVRPWSEALADYLDSTTFRDQGGES